MKYNKVKKEMNRITKNNAYKLHPVVDFWV